MIRRILQSLREYKKDTIITIIFMFFEALMETLTFFYTARFIDSYQSGMTIEEIVRAAIILTAMAIISFTCGALGARTSARAATGLSRNLRHDIFKNVQQFSFNNIDKFSSSSLVTRMTTDITYVQMSFMMVIRIAIRSPLMLIFSIVMAYILGGMLSLTFVVVIPIMVFGLIVIARIALPAFRRVFKKYDKLNESIEENIGAARDVKGYVREEFEKTKLDTSADNIRKEFTFAEKVVAINNPLMQGCMFIVWIMIIVLGSKLTIVSGGVKMGAGSISVLVTYGFQVLMALMLISMIYVMITISLESGNRIVEALEEVPTIQNTADPVFEVADGSIDFENVDFKYHENAKNNTLSDLNIHIDSGMTVGILGNTGSGKSSFVQLIPRLYDVSNGVVKVGGKNVKEYDIQTLRDNVAFVLQKNTLFSGTIRENLKWGNENATDEEIINACKLSQAWEFVSLMPEGLDTYIDQGGTNVSGGQKQRLCIARALLKKPKILILDDSTSAVDTKTDALIREGFKEFIPTTTKIIVSQRISSVESSDIIIILRDGKITSYGTHDELMKSSDMYRDTYISQTRKGGEHDE